MNSSNPRPPLVILTCGLYWCLGAMACAYVVFAFVVLGKMSSFFRELGVDPAAAPQGDNGLGIDITKLASMYQLIPLLVTALLLFGGFGTLGATMLFQRRKSGLTILRMVTWIFATPCFFWGLWAIATTGTAGISTFVQCTPFAVLLALLYSKQVRDFGVRTADGAHPQSNPAPAIA